MFSLHANIEDRDSVVKKTEMINIEWILIFTLFISLNLPHYTFLHDLTSIFILYISSAFGSIIP